MKRKFRITRSIDFKRVRRLGKTYTHPLAALTVAQGEGENSRAGIVTGKAIGNAVKRNRAKRQLRAVLAGFLPNLTKKCDILLVAREPIHSASFFELKSVIRQLLSRADLINLDEHDK